VIRHGLNSELADAMLAEYRAFEEYYRCRNADPETRQEKLEAWWAAAMQRRFGDQSREFAPKNGRP
jgi:hypothetical protein